MAEPAQVLSQTRYTPLGIDIIDEHLKTFSALACVVLLVILVQWYIRRPRLGPTLTMYCSCVSCKKKKPLFQAYANPGFHHRPGNKLHYETIIPSAQADCKGTIIFLHGLLSAGRSWVPIAQAVVEEGYCCYMPDLLGFGRSPWPSIEYNVESHCEYLVATVREIMAKEHRSQPIHIVGHSMGALLAYELEAALRKQSKRAQNEGLIIAKSMTLFSTPYYREEGDAVKAVKLTPKGLFVRFMINCPGMSCLLCSVLCQQRWFWVPVANAFWTVVSFFGVHHDISTSHQIEDFTLHSYHSCAGSFNTIDRHRMSVDRTLPPILLVHGERDDIVPIEQSRAFAKDLRNAAHHVELVEVKTSDHALITHPQQIEETMTIIRQWLSRF